MEVLLKLAYDKPVEVIRIFTEYTNSIINKNSEVAECLDSQHYDDETSIC